MIWIVVAVSVLILLLFMYLAFCRRPGTKIVGDLFKAIGELLEAIFD